MQSLTTMLWKKKKKIYIYTVAKSKEVKTGWPNSRQIQQNLLRNANYFDMLTGKTTVIRGFWI
jgi:hypothetical protein